MARMQAVVLRGYGEPEALEYGEVERPEPGAGEVLVEAAVAGVNFADTMQRRNAYHVQPPLPATLGTEAAGTVVDVGGGVEGVSEGERVVAALEGGGYAEYASAPANTLMPLPAEIGFEEAIVVPVQGLTAYHALSTAGRLAEGETVLVHAAAGGVGVLAVQMARLMGAGTVIASAGSREKLEIAEALGADVLLDYSGGEDWPEKVREATGGRGADVILETIGGDFVQQNLSCLAPFGRMVAYGMSGGEVGSVAPIALSLRNQSVVGFYVRPILGIPELLNPSLERIFAWISAGELRLSVGSRYPLERAADAHADIESRRTTGKVVLFP